MSNSIAMKKLAIKTLARYNLSSVNEVSLKEMIAGEGYTVIRFSSLGTTDETSRLLSTLYLEDRIRYQDSFTYNDRERRIVFVRKDVSDGEFLYLMAVELGKILTFKTECDGVIGTSAEEERYACEFAFHMCDFADHGIVYNFFKTHTVPSIVSAASVIAVISIFISFFCMKVFTNTNNLSNVNVINVDAMQIAENNASELSSENVSLIQTDSVSAYYATKSGNKYHSADCAYIAGKELKSVTAEEISSGKYSACSRCIK